MAQTIQYAEKMFTRLDTFTQSGKITYNLGLQTLLNLANLQNLLSYTVISLLVFPHNFEI